MSGSGALAGSSVPAPVETAKIRGGSASTVCSSPTVGYGGMDGDARREGGKGEGASWQLDKDWSSILLTHLLCLGVYWARLEGRCLGSSD